MLEITNCLFQNIDLLQYNYFMMAEGETSTMASRVGKQSSGATKIAQIKQWAGCDDIYGGQ